MEFKVNGETYEVKRPTSKQLRESVKYYNQAFSEAVKSNALVRAKLNDVLEEQDLWNEKKEAKFESLREEIRGKEKILERGGIKLSEAREVALALRDLRGDLQELLMVRSELDNQTAEGQSENSKFNYLVSACVQKGGKPYFKNYDDYMEKSDDGVALEGAKTLMIMMYGLEADPTDSLPENKFMRDFFPTEEEPPTVVEEEKVEFSAFLDESGNPIEKEIKEEKEERSELVDESE